MCSHTHAQNGDASPSGRRCQIYEHILPERLLQAIRAQASDLVECPNFWLPLVCLCLYL